jgi:hypothetical protein
MGEANQAIKHFIAHPIRWPGRTYAPRAEHLDHRHLSKIYIPRFGQLLYFQTATLEFRLQQNSWTSLRT